MCRYRAGFLSIDAFRPLKSPLALLLTSKGKQRQVDVYVGRGQGTGKDRKVRFVSGCEVTSLWER